jgi:hypothetical protein
LPLLVRYPAGTLCMAYQGRKGCIAGGRFGEHIGSWSQMSGGAVIAITIHGNRSERWFRMHRSDPAHAEPVCHPARAPRFSQKQFFRKCELLHTRVPRGRLSLWCPGQGLAIFGRANYPLRRRELFAPTNAGVTDSAGPASPSLRLIRATGSTSPARGPWRMLRRPRAYRSLFPSRHRRCA